MSNDLPLKSSMDFAYGVPRTLAPGVVRLVANNPGPFTFRGTNTYLVGSDDLAIIDPGPADAAHIDALVAAADGRPVSHILLTHTHLDHSAGLPLLLAALPDGQDVKICGYGRVARAGGAADISPSGQDFIDSNFAPDTRLRDGDQLKGSGWLLTALHTPGHAPDHLCFALEGTGVIFSGDHVMGWNTSVVAPPEGNMADYMGSLEKLLARKDDRLMLPGHGGQIDEPERMVRAFLVHRTMREKAIMRLIREGTSTIPAIVAELYKDLDERLVSAASLSVMAHVEHLIMKDRVSCDGDVSFAAVLAAV